MRAKKGDQLCKGQKFRAAFTETGEVSGMYVCSRFCYVNVGGQWFSCDMLVLSYLLDIQVELLSRQLNMEPRTYGRGLISKCKLESTQSINVTENHESV